MNLEQQAIENIKLGAQMSEQYYGKPIICTYSGGKDSEVLLHLFKRSGVEFEVHNSHTTVDAPQTVYHIREVFEKLDEEDIKTQIIYPTYKGKRTSMWKLIVDMGIPPTRLIRYCCKILKETDGRNRVIATGVRKFESVGRMDRKEIVACGKTAKEAIYISNKDFLDFDNDDTRRVVERCQLKSKISINPIINWTDSDVWHYIHENNIKYNPLYDMGYDRVGCVGCPMASLKIRQKEFFDFPVYKRNYLKAFERMLSHKNELGKETGSWKSANDVMEWWLFNRVKNSYKLFDYSKIY